MPSTFYGIELGRRGLAASQLALDVVGHNTTNVNTPGYSRQVANFTATDPYTLPDRNPQVPGQLGTGVVISSVTQVRDAFVDRRLQTSQAAQGSLDILANTLSRVEEAYNDPVTPGVGSLMQDLFNGFSDLSTNAESGPVRATVRNRAEALVSGFRSLNTTLDQILPELKSRIGVIVGEVNDLSKQIAGINKQIRLATAVGDQPNDLLDKRNLLLEKLSRLVEVDTVGVLNPQTQQPNGEINVSVGGFALVQSEVVNELPNNVDYSEAEPTVQPYPGLDIPIRSGELHGAIKAQKLVEGYKADLDALAAQLITSVNTLHSAGYGLDGVTARNFFTGTTAASIEVNTDIKNNLNAIAAATPPVPPQSVARGNGDNARALAALSYNKVIGSFSLIEYYNANIAIIGSDARAYNDQQQNEEIIQTQIRSLQLSVSGVSLDEELTRLLQYQRSYQAAARVLNVMDDAIDRIINQLGR